MLALTGVLLETDRRRYGPTDERSLPNQLLKADIVSLLCMCMLEDHEELAAIAKALAEHLGVASQVEQDVRGLAEASDSSSCSSSGTRPATLRQ